MPFIHHHYDCDFCRKRLIGSDGESVVSNDYISIKGAMSLQLRDHETGHRYWIGIMSSPNAPKNFCDLYCLQDYIDMKEKEYRDSREARLRAEVPDVVL